MSARKPASGSERSSTPNANSRRFTLDPDDLFRPRPRRRRAHRLLRRATAVAATLALMVAVMACGLFFVTPSVHNAWQLAMTQGRAHHAVFPGPPVPPRFAAALVATEDHRFYSEPGLDPFAVGRVIAARVTGGPDQGGATLYQQLAKLLYTTQSSGPEAKAEQVVLAVKLDLSYSKRQILQMYAAIAYFGHRFYGLTAASCGYFAQPPSRLSWAQAATLAGIVQAPSADDPLVHPAMARAREAHVLGRLVATHMLTNDDAAVALGTPLSRLAARPTGGQAKAGGGQAKAGNGTAAPGNGCPRARGV
jgi:membrane peptidoglycan carboxypeptidase